LLTVAEVSVAFAGFASLITVLAKQNASDWSEGNVVRFYTMIFHSLFSTLFALLPFSFLAFEIDPLTAWKYSGAVLGGYLSLNLIFGMPHTARLAKTGELSIYAVAFTQTLMVGCLLVQFLSLLGVLVQVTEPILSGL